MRMTRCRLEFKLPDLWVGAYFRTTHATTGRGKESMFTDIWICLLPCVPLHLTFFHTIAIPFDAPEATPDERSTAA